MESKLNLVMTRMPEGMPLTSARLAEAGVSADLAVRYARSGWLNRLARGVYQRAGDALELHPTLRMLEAEVPGLHVGGKTALDWYGVRQYVVQRPTLLLYGWEAWRVPAWFNERFPARYHRKRLFRETPAAMAGVSRFNDAPDAPLVSEPERALLELLSEVGVRQPLVEASELAEGMHTLRRDRLIELLRSCTSVKTVRLCLMLGREHGMPWAEGLEAAGLPTGSKSRWVARSKGGLLVLKP